MLQAAAFTRAVQRPHTGNLKGSEERRGCRKCESSTSTFCYPHPALAWNSVHGHTGDCFKVPAKGNCVTTCLISPGCKTICSQRRLFPSAGAARAGGLMFYLQARVQRGTKCLEKFSMNRDIALSYSLFPDSSVSILTKCFFAWIFFPIWKCGFKWSNIRSGGDKGNVAIVTDVFQYSSEGRWNEAKRKLASTWALEQNKAILFQNIHPRWKKLFSSVLLLFF